MPTVEFQGVRKVFPSGRVALDGVDLLIGDREFFAVLGPSGSGKSTILRLIAGLAEPTGGVVILGGRPGESLRPHDRDAAVVFQNQALYPHLSVRENLAASARAAGVDRAEIARRVAEATSLLGLGDHLDVRPAQLSGGQAQRVALGRAFVRRPSLLLLDEPFSNLDPPLRAALIEDLAALHRRIGGTTVLVTHDQQEAASLADRIAFLDAGRVVQVGPPRSFFDRPETVSVARFFGDPPRAMVPARVEASGRLILGGEGPDCVPVGGPGVSLPGVDSRPFLLGLGPEELEVVAFSEEDPTSPNLGFAAPCDRVVERDRERLGRLQIGREIAWGRLRPGLEAAGGLAVVALHLERASTFDPQTGARLGGSAR